MAPTDANLVKLILFFFHLASQPGWISESPQTNSRSEPYWSLVFVFCRFWAWSSPWQCSASQWKWRPSTPRKSTSEVLRTFGLFLIRKDKYSLCSRSFSSASSSFISSCFSYRLFFPTLVPSVTFQLRCHKFTVFFHPLLTTNKHSVSVIPEFHGLLCV